MRAVREHQAGVAFAAVAVRLWLLAEEQVPHVPCEGLLAKPVSAGDYYRVRDPPGVECLKPDLPGLL